MLTMCILNYNDSETTKALVNHIKDYSIIDHIIVVDNKSTDDSFLELQTCISDKVEIIQTTKNGGYGFGNNEGIRYAKNHYNSRLVCICNPDVSIEEISLKKCVEFINGQKDCIIVAPQMVDRNGIKQDNCGWPIQSGIKYLLFSLKIVGRFFNSLYDDLNDGTTPYCVDCVAGSCLIIDTEKFKRIGMYDEKIFLYCEETVVGIKAKSYLYKTYIIRTAFFKHLHSESINKSISSLVKQKRIMWRSRLYVLKEYYHWEKAALFFAVLVSKIAILEEMLLSQLKGMKNE